MTRTSSLALPPPVNSTAGDIDPRALRVVRRLVCAVDDVQQLGPPFDAAIDPILDALVTTARAADALRNTSTTARSTQKRRAAA